MIINLEGLDGAGKSTQAELSARNLARRGLPVRVFHFPDYQTPTGIRIKAALQDASAAPRDADELYRLFAANRREVQPQIEAALARGEVVLLDRYCASGWAYGVARGRSEEWLISLDRGLPLPDLVVVLDVPVALAQERMAHRRRDAYEGDTALLEAVRRAYLDLALRHGWRVVSDERPPEEVQRELWAAMEGMLEDAGL